MKIIVRCAVIFVLAGIGIGIWVWREADTFLNTPPEVEGREIYFDVAPGARLPQIACDLADKGLITDAGKFTLLARLKKQDSHVQAGRFALNSGWTPERTLEALVNGAPVLFRITIPEGLTWWQTARILENAGIARAEDLQEIIFDPAFLRYYGIPFKSAEGFLMPDTYFLRKPDIPMPNNSIPDAEAPEKALKTREIWKTQARLVAGRLVENFWRKAAAAWPDGGEDVEDFNVPKQQRIPGEDRPVRYMPPENEQLKKWMILASIVEKETGLEHERSRVAGVYANRLKKNMLLQADPTVIYGLGENFNGTLRKIHLADEKNIYNTYKNAGLPPGPICSFGIAALKAAIRPEKHNYLYFVAESGQNGGHTFSRTFEEHGRAVQEYRQQRRKD